jgi:23S rRNA (cytosine1962-C5)-methyltransferase
MARATRARLTPHGAERVRSGHLWVYRDDVQNLDRLSEDPVVTVTDGAQQPLGRAFLSRTSRIALRMLTRRDEEIDVAFWRRRIREALALRERLALDGDACRLLHAEGDRVPSVVVDRYGPYLVAQFQSRGADALKHDIAQALVEEVSPRGILERSDRAPRQREGLPRSTGALAGSVPPTVEVRMNGLRLTVNLETGQKTGAFLDQRENYLAARRWARGRVADCFCYSGGFALHAAGAPSVGAITGVDGSEPALELAHRNAEGNGLSGIRWIHADLFDWLKKESARPARYDTIILDPPAFAQTRSGIAGALRGYTEVNLRALLLLRPGGILITCSCSHHVSAARFEEMLGVAARDARRSVQILEKRGQPPDHPILASMPETEYLKCFVLRAL